MEIYYQYVNEKGVTVFTNNPGTIPANQKPDVFIHDKRKRSKEPISDTSQNDFIHDKIVYCKELLSKTPDQHRKMSFKEQDAVLMILAFCEQRDILLNLNSEEKANLHKHKANLKEEGMRLTNEQRSYLKEKRQYVFKNWEKIKSKEKDRDFESYSNEEMNKLDLELKSIWNHMSNALANNDIKKAIKYFHIKTKSIYERQFSSLPKGALLKLAQKNKEAQLAFDHVLGNSIRYHLITTKNGQRYSFQLTYIQDFKGEWKIYNY